MCEEERTMSTCELKRDGLFLKKEPARFSLILTINQPILYTCNWLPGKDIFFLKDVIFFKNINSSQIIEFIKKMGATDLLLLLLLPTNLLELVI